ncbi:hypothetical protein H4R34_001445 [Dimargaris verticillata]|uniref:L-serine ammonia-lyase n=1 Tax=Dimargaris verticillata TaxID=2761393 RepID=A0A9W8B665_9FUNG|nr:hypothetical protein H4R34_001445 [Dimargaris verticillata]
MPASLTSAQKEAQCPVCFVLCLAVPLDGELSPTIQRYFTPTHELLDELVEVVKFQLKNTASLVHHLRTKNERQKQVLKRAKEELLHMKELKKQVRELQAERHQWLARFQAMSINQAAAAPQLRGTAAEVSRSDYTGQGGLFRPAPQPSSARPFSFDTSFSTQRGTLPLQTRVNANPSHGTRGDNCQRGDREAIVSSLECTVRELIDDAPKGLIIEANALSPSTLRRSSAADPISTPEPSSEDGGDGMASADQTTEAANPEEDTCHAVVSTFDLFSIGIGPSSSHTVGPMRASKIFISDLEHYNLTARVHRLRVDLYGSLALTGVGHGTPDAILIGLEGDAPETVETNTISSRIQSIKDTCSLALNGQARVQFDPAKDMVFHYFESLPQHSNGMRFTAYDASGDMLATNEYFSIGGGFVVCDQTQVAHGDNLYFRSYDIHQENVPDNRKTQDVVAAALPFRNGQELLHVCKRLNMTIAEVVYENELKWRSAAEIQTKMRAIWNTMDQSIRNGCLSSEPYLPGRLHVKRRAPRLYQNLMRGIYRPAGSVESIQPSYSFTASSTTTTTTGATSSATSEISDAELAAVGDTIPSIGIVRPSSVGLPNATGRPRQTRRFNLPALDYLSVYAIAVNEENAAGGRVVTAPTNGAAGVIPAVLKYHLEFLSENPEHDILEFMFTAAAIGMLYKRGASISAAEVGCQGEVGVACSMSAGAFAAVMGGTPEQIENAAEIGMEHNLGLTCDPVDGLVQIPCIERNALGAVKAVTAAQLALNGDGGHRVTLDQVIESMRQTGLDMQSKYKETSQGGLAVNVPFC